MGILTPGAFDPWAGDDAPFDLAAVYQSLVARDELAGFEVPERFYEIGSTEGLEEHAPCWRDTRGRRRELRAIFAPGPLPEPVDFSGVRIGLPICEDMWFAGRDATSREAWRRAAARAERLAFRASRSSISVSTLAAERVRETGLPLVYVNQVGGQDELVFDGGSFVVNADGASRRGCRSGRKRRHDDAVDVASSGRCACEPQAVAPAFRRARLHYHAMMLGLRDYVSKNRFPGVVLGMSGGIDSALTAAVAVDALGAARVTRRPASVALHERREPGRRGSESARRLGMHDRDDFDRASRSKRSSGRWRRCSPVARATSPKRTSRRACAALLLMALSNKFGELLVTTGNKSEMSVGYATLYGDMCGGYSVLKDIYKTEVYALSRVAQRLRAGRRLGPAGEVDPGDRR